MERLTYKGTGIKSGEDKEYDCTIINPTMLPKALIKLREYEDLEEQGLLHKAPVPNGTFIYVVRYNNWCEENFIDAIEYIHGLTENLLGEMNKDWFLTEEEAEQKLKES